MNKFGIRFILAFMLLIPAQAVIFNHMVLFGVAVPLVFIWLIVMMPITLGTNMSTFLGFLCGLTLDVFCDTPGVNALSCTLLSFTRKPIFHLYATYDEDLAGRSPSSRSMGHFIFVKYLLTVAFIYSLLVFTIEAFQIFNFRLWILRVSASTLYTFILLYAFDCLSFDRRNQ